MKKKILSIAMVAAIALVAGVTISKEKKETSLSDVMLSNVEALAQSESSEDFYEKTGCKAVWENVTCKGKDGKTHSYAKP